MMIKLPTATTMVQPKDTEANENRNLNFSKQAGTNNKDTKNEMYIYSLHQK